MSFRSRFRSALCVALGYRDGDETDEVIAAVIAWKWSDPPSFWRVCRSFGLVSRVTATHVVTPVLDPPAIEVRPERTLFGTSLHLTDTCREVVLEALRRANGVQKDAAKMLGISIRAMSYQIKALGLAYYDAGGRRSYYQARVRQTT